MHQVSDTGNIAEFTQALDNKFYISGWLMIVPIVTGIMIAKKVPSLITLFISTALAITFAVIFQPNLLAEIAGDAGSHIMTLTKGALATLFTNTNLDAG